ncbi:MAG: hypothetical protein M3459_10360 [Actinomycetota bacterium]|nr:hypothetical protein [Actinomycetota bacterium]
MFRTTRRWWGRLGLPEQLIALRLLSVVMFGCGLFLGFEDNTAILGACRGVGAVLALLTGLLAVWVVLGDPAGSGAPRRRRRTVAWTYATIALTGAAGFGLLLVVGLTSGLWWTVAGAIAIGLALGARVMVGLTGREGGALPHLSGHDGDSHGWIERTLTDTRLVAGSLIAGLVGLAATLTLFVASEAVGGSFEELPFLLVMVLVLLILGLFVGLVASGLFSILPLSLFAPELGGGLLRRLMGRSSGIQPLPDLVATAITSVAAQAGQRRDRG